MIGVSRPLLSLLVLAALPSEVRAEEGRGAAQLARQLSSADPDVHRSAEVALVIEHRKDGDAILAAVEKAGAPASSVARVREARRLAAALGAAPKDAVAFWSLLEKVLAPEWHDLEPAILLSVAGAAQRATWLAQRNAALDVVTRFCARGSMPAPLPLPAAGAPAGLPLPPAPAHPSADPLCDELMAQGVRAVPHLLHALASDPWTSFVGHPGATFAVRPAAALDLGGAIVAIAKLRAREAIPYLLLHMHGPSVTLESNAAAALSVLTGQSTAYKPDGGGIDDAAVFAWWGTRRGAHPEEIHDFVEAVLEALLEGLPFLDRRPDFAEGFAAFGQPVGATFAALERISGRPLGPVPTGSLEEQLRGIRAALAAERARPPEVAPTK